MCDRCDDLAFEVRELKKRLGEVIGKAELRAIRKEFGEGLGPYPAKVLIYLRNRGGVPAKQASIHSTIYGDRIDGGPNVKIIDVWVCRIRKLLGRDSVLHLWGEGYYLSPEWSDKITGILDAA